MAKADALARIDRLIDKGSHAKLNTDPGTRIVHELKRIREMVDEITEAQ